MRTAIIRTATMLVLALYMVLLFPTHLNVFLEYTNLKDEYSKLSSEMSVLANSLLRIQDVDTIIKNSGYEIALCSVIEQGGDSTLMKSYNGEELEPKDDRIVEYYIKPSTNGSSYFFAYLSSYELSYDRIAIEETGEIVVSIYCK